MTCSGLKIRIPTSTSGYKYIYPQGPNTKVRVYCDMTSKNGVGVTEIGHDSESRTLVNGYESPGSYKRNIYYDLSTEQIVAIMKHSKNCEQYIRYDCYGSRLLSNGYGW